MDAVAHTGAAGVREGARERRAVDRASRGVWGVGQAHMSPRLDGRPSICVPRLGAHTWLPICAQIPRQTTQIHGSRPNARGPPSTCTRDASYPATTFPVLLCTTGVNLVITVTSVLKRCMSIRDRDTKK